MFSKKYKQLTPYTPGEQPQNRKYIKLNTNENPFPPSPLIEEYLKTADTDLLKLYPDPGSVKLRETIGKYYNLPASMVFTGNGSDEVLSFCFYAFFDNENGPLLFPEHSYSFIQYIVDSMTFHISEYTSKKIFQYLLIRILKKITIVELSSQIRMHPQVHI